jgi:crossover junction endodeoxyribonuclease RuvC
MFTFGFVTGALHGILAALGIPIYMVTPQAWKKVILAGTPKDKLASIEYCTRVYPYVDLHATPRSTTMHNGIADAICIAAYAKTLHR